MDNRTRQELPRDCQEDKQTGGKEHDIRKYFFSERVVQRWNKLSQEAVDQRTINGFEKALDKKNVNRKS